MVSRFILKLRRFAPLNQADEEMLAGLVRTARVLRPRCDVAVQGLASSLLPVILDGWACRHRLLENGKRQITALYLPGDICEPFGALPRLMDSTVSTLTRAMVANVSPISFRSVACQSPRMEEALWRDLLMASSIDQERLVSIGRRSAVERLGHLFCEIHFRLSLVGLADTTDFDLQMSQLEMSDLLGLTAVHVSRSLRNLKEAGLISLQGRRLIIHDLDRLRCLSFFEPTYIHAQATEPSLMMDGALAPATK